MDIKKKLYYVDLSNLISISNGDSDRMMKYLNQFNSLIPERLYYLNQALLIEDRESIRQILHKMSPQIQFFGIKDIISPIQRMEYEYNTIPEKELKNLINEIIIKLENALKEINEIIKLNSE